jgi:MFS family permease
MVITHLPSNILLILVPLMPNLSLTVLVLLVRFSISQMDVPTRQSYTMAVVSAEERSAAAGITGVARTTGAAISPLFVGLMFARPSLINDVTGEICTKWNERESTWRKSWSCQSRGTNQSKS